MMSVLLHFFCFALRPLMMMFTVHLYNSRGIFDLRLETQAIAWRLDQHN